jgi:hypothetical protein
MRDCWFIDPKFAEVVDLSNAMGLYLQKTNIIRDYLEDISQNPPRVFYPKDVWLVLSLIPSPPSLSLTFRFTFTDRFPSLLLIVHSLIYSPSHNFFLFLS